MKKALILSTILLSSHQNTFTAQAAEANPNGAQFEPVISFRNGSNNFALSANGRIIAATSLRALTVCNSSTRSMTTLDTPTPNGSNKCFLGVSFANNGLFVASTDRPEVWDPKTKECWVVCDNPEELIHCAQLSPDGAKLLTIGSIPPKVPNIPTEQSDHVTRDATNFTAKIWNAQTKTLLCVLNTGVRLGLLGPNSNFWSPNGGLVALPLEKSIGVWNYYNNKPLHVLPRNRKILASIEISPNQEILAAAEFFGPVKTWCLKTGAHLQEFNGGHIERCCNIFFINDMHFITPSRDGTVRFWDAKTGENLKALKWNKNKIISAAFCPETKILAVGSTSKTVMTWDIETSKCLQEIHCSGWVHKVALDKGAKTLVIASDRENREGVTIQVFRRFNYD